MFIQKHFVHITLHESINIHRRAISSFLTELRNSHFLRGLIV